LRAAAWMATIRSLGPGVGVSTVLRERLRNEMVSRALDGLEREMGLRVVHLPWLSVHFLYSDNFRHCNSLQLGDPQLMLRKRELRNS
jgi:hypothetical protein